MAIFEQTSYMMECNRCKKFYGESEFDGPYVYIDRQTMMEDAQDEDWLIEENACYCPDCYTMNEDSDEATIKE